MEEFSSPDSPIQDDNVPSLPSVHQELLSDNDTSMDELDKIIGLPADPPSTTLEVATPVPPVILPDVLTNLVELTPGVTAALKRMFDENRKREKIVAQIKEQMELESLSE